MLPQDWLLVTLLNWGTPEIGTELAGCLPDVVLAVDWL